MRLQVKVAIVKSGRRGYEIASALNWHPAKLSQIINEVYTPSSLEMELLSEELQVPVNELFPPKRPRVTA